MNRSINIPFCCGIDEAGRGPVAGPVCAASVILPQSFDCSILNDSKKLSETKRTKAAQTILNNSFWYIDWASQYEIDQINIHNATLLAMARSFEGLIRKYTFDASSIETHVDGLFSPKISCACIKAYPKADASSFPVMAASILAKTARDRMMLRYDWLYPSYGYAQHKGYPTKKHVEVIKKEGPSPIQRRSFLIKSLLSHV